MVNKIKYRMLTGEKESASRGALTQHDDFDWIAKVLRRIHLDFHGEGNVATIAHQVTRSAAAFHTTIQDPSDTAAPKRVL